MCGGGVCYRAPIVWGLLDRPVGSTTLLSKEGVVLASDIGHSRMNDLNDQAVLHIYVLRRFEGLPLSPWIPAFNSS